MKLAKPLENSLHEIVKHKRGYIAQMEGHRDLQKRWGYNKLAKVTKSNIDDDRDHVKAINKYIVERDGVPKNLTSDVDIKTNVPDQVAADLQNEVECVKRLNDFIVQSRDSKEDKARRVIEHVLKDDEKHLAALEKQQNLMSTLGMQGYLAKVSKV